MYDCTVLCRTFTSKQSAPVAATSLERVANNRRNHGGHEDVWSRNNEMILRLALHMSGFGTAHTSLDLGKYMQMPESRNAGTPLRSYRHAIAG